MQSNKTNITAVVLLALVLTACSSTVKPSVTPIKVVERVALPPVSSELLAVHERPERPAGGSPQHLLTHAVAYGGWCQKLEAQVSGWQAWYRREQTE